MFFFSRLRKQKPARRRLRSGGTAVTAVARYRPRLEALEDRTCPSGGVLDPTFGNGAGYVTVNPGGLNNGGLPYAVAIYPGTGGKIVAAGLSVVDLNGSPRGNIDISLVRTNADGTPDLSWNGSGQVIT